MGARVQIEIEANDNATAVLRGIASHFGAIGGAVADLQTLFDSQAKTAELSAIAMNAVATGADNADEAIKALAQAENEQDAASVRLTESLASLAVEGIKKAAEFAADAYNEFQDYAQAVRDLALASGQTAEEASRMIQVLDDFQISAQDVTAATRTMTREGLTPNMETLAQLSDQYLTITDAQERNEFVIKNLGRAGLQWVNMLNQGGDALRAMSAEVDKNLVLNDEMIAKAEQERLAMDALSDAWQGFKVQVGAAVGELILTVDNHQKVIERLKEQGVWVGRGVEYTQAYKDELTKLNEEQKVQAETTQNVTAAIADEAEAAKAISEKYTNLISSIMDYQDATDKYNETNADIITSERELIQSKNELQAKYNSLTDYEKKYTSEGKKIPGQIEEINKKLNEHSQDLAKNAEEYRKWAAQTVFSFAQARAAADGNISEIEGQVLIEAGEALGLFDEKTATAMQSVNESFDNLDASNAQEVIANLQAQLNALVGTDYTVTVNVAGNTSTGGTTPGRQTGGTVYAGQQYMVGEAGPEPFFPSVNGRVLSHAEALHAMSLGGGGGQTNYIYGPVTLAISADGAGGLMEMR